MREPRERPDLKKSASSESCPSKTLTLCGDVMRAAEQRASDDLQYEEAEEEYSRMSWEEDRIIKAVNAIPAKTEAGLRVRALAVCLSRIHSLSHPPSQLDWCDLAARRMLESFISVLGIAVANDLITTDTPEAA